MFGFITAKAMGQDFTALMEKRLLPALGLTSSYIEVPQASLAAYAQGYSKTGEPIRMATAILSPEAYGGERRPPPT
jgi:Beta-lactamase.